MSNLTESNKSTSSNSLSEYEIYLEEMYTHIMANLHDAFILHSPQSFRIEKRITSEIDSLTLEYETNLQIVYLKMING